MTTRFNLYYLVLILIGLALVSTVGLQSPNSASFYGLAESRATEINYNYPVMVDQILVKEGQAVKEGDRLLLISRRKAKETLDDQNYRIAHLQAEQAVWREKLTNEIERITLEKQSKIADLQRKMEEINQEISAKQALYQGLSTIDPPSSTYSPLQESVGHLKDEIAGTESIYTSKISGLESQLQLGRNPYTTQIERLQAQQQFEEDQKVQHIVVTAPSDGLVGNINCKEAEHIASYSSLMTFYEPHSTIIKGYVHEDLTLTVGMGQSFTVSSLKDPAIQYQGHVIGLGSRIVEIPARLRKIETFKAYGREVLLEIPVDNDFLQKEKVSIQFIDHELPQ